VGTNPHFEGLEQRIEAYILDRTDCDLYGERVEFEFTEFLRDQQVFGDLDDYLAQMVIDVKNTRELVC
jgi:riboflavin kinase/FMN adenylyltransferase